MHDFVLVYAKDKEKFVLNDLPRANKQNKAYKNTDDDPRGVWKATPLHARNYYSLGRYSVSSPSGRVIDGPPSGTYWRVSEENFHLMNKDNRIWWGVDGDGVPSQKRFLTEVRQGVTPNTLWLHSEAGHNGEAKNELRSLLPDTDDLFVTPKPERLLSRVLRVATNPNDLILDSFARLRHHRSRRPQNEPPLDHDRIRQPLPHPHHPPPPKSHRRPRRRRHHQSHKLGKAAAASATTTSPPPSSKKTNGTTG